VAIFHLLKYGFRNFTTFFALIIFIGVSAALLLYSYDYLIKIDWQMNVSVFENYLDSNNLFQ
jgi:hypothetical protein